MDKQEFELQDEGKSYVQISDDMRLSMSPRNWQLQKKLVAQSDTNNQSKGDTSWVSFKWYTQLDSALKDIIHINTSKEFFNDATSFIQANNKVINDIKKAFTPDYNLISK